MSNRNNNREARIVGGMLGLEYDLHLTNSPPPFLNGNHLALVNARSGVRILIEVLKPSTVWMPAFLCDAVLAGVPDSTMVRFYGVTRDLRIGSVEWVENVSQGDLVLLIDYFGFPCDGSACRAVQARGAWVLEDASHALLSSHVGRHANFIIYSPRKMLAVPDGGVLVIRNFDNWPVIELKPAPPAWVLKTIEALVLRREFDIHGGERYFFPLFQQIEASTPVGAYEMSGLTQLLLEHSFDYPAIAHARRQNYQKLATILRHVAIFPDLHDNVVPLGFPIRIPCRDRVRRGLFLKDIYPPIHWSVPQQVPRDFADSYRLAEEIMTLVCDQRYGISDMERVAEIVTHESMLAARG
jgi:dTDP-4-amino-4,6-dideoxygalactose transaminase